MDNVIKAGKWLLQTLFFVFTLSALEIRKVLFAAKYVDSEYRVQDFMEVFKPTRFFFIFNILAFFIFLLLPQGKDVLLIVIEDLSNRSFLSLLSLLLGVAGWSIVAEFGARYKLYVTDNSAFSISAERVEYRKQLQRFFSMVYLLLPFLLVLISLVVITITEIKHWTFDVAWPFVVSLIAITFLLKQISQFYLDEPFRSDFGKKFTSISNFLILPPEELKWASKLQGIYNDFVVRIRWKAYFTDVDPETHYVREKYTNYIDLILEPPTYSADHPEGFPNHYVVSGELPKPPLQSDYPKAKPKEYFLDFSNPKHFEQKEDTTGAYRWIYKIKPSFYKHLHRQLFVISLTSLIVLLLITSPYDLLSDHIGAPALVCLSFGCWQGIYIGLLYLDACAFRYFPLSIRWLLLGWLLFCSYFNLDHPIRTLPCNPVARPDLVTHFDRWKAKHDTLLSKRWASYHVADSIKQPTDSIPVIFITAEGGALRTGAFTALLLSSLQDSFKCFRDDIYSFSSISGGSLGVSFFNAVAYLNPDTLIRPGPGYYTNLARTFFDCDQLSPVLSKMFYGDPISALSLWPIEPFDRAIALENAWEDDYQQLFPQSNIYSMDFLSRYRDTSRVQPAWFINTTEVETGLQCYLSNVRPTSFVFNDQRDLLNQKIRGSVRYSTAVNFSSRFPLISPSAALKQNDQLTYHYVDGGYVENTGAKTMLELLTALHNDSGKNHLAHIKPYVIQIRFNSENTLPNTGFLNEFSSILYGIYDTRNGSSNTSAEMLRRYTTDTLKGNYISVPLMSPSAEVPVNWVLSERSMHHLMAQIDTIMRSPYYLNHTVNQLHDLYLFDSDYIHKLGCPPSLH